MPVPVSTELQAFAHEIASDFDLNPPESGKKGIAFITIATLVITIIQMLYGWWKAKHPATPTADMQKAFSEMGLFRKWMLKRYISRKISQDLDQSTLFSSHGDAIFEKVLQKTATEKETRIATIKSEVFVDESDFSIF